MAYLDSSNVTDLVGDIKTLADQTYATPNERTNNYIKFPDGLFIQFGMEAFQNVAADTIQDLAIEYPITFPLVYDDDPNTPVRNPSAVTYAFSSSTWSDPTNYQNMLRTDNRVGMWIRVKLALTTDVIIYYVAIGRWK